MAIFLSGIYAIIENGKILILTLLIAIFAFGLNILNYFLKMPTLHLLTICFFGLFFVSMAAVILYYITKAKRVTFDIITGAICGYLLLGMIWTMLFSLIEIILPGSFLINGQSIMTAYGDFQRPIYTHLVYYSFVTLTTLGYGDISPASPPARAFSSLEAITGQLYIAILIARLVALQILHSQSQE